MKTSEKFTKVMMAMCEIQEFMTVAPDGENAHLKAKYATLDNILKTIKPHLKGVGLVPTQDTDEKEKSVTVTTRVTHAESGEWFESKSTVPIERTSAQGVGSSTTYGRRYSLCTALGIGMNNDDDGNGAEKALTKAEEKKLLADDFQKYKGSSLPRLMKYDAEALQMAFDESGYVSECEDKEEMLRELVNQTNTKEKLIMIGKRAVILQKEIDASLEKAD